MISNYSIVSATKKMPNDSKKINIRYKQEHHTIFENILQQKFQIRIVKKKDEKVDLYEFDLMEYHNNDANYLSCGNICLFYKKDDVDFPKKLFEIIQTHIPNNNNKMVQFNINTTCINCLNMQNPKFIWTGDNGVQIKYPVNILSLGRYTDELGTTHKILTDLKINHYLFVEAKEESEYKNWYNPEYCTLVVSDINFSEQGLGGSLMRNYILNYHENSDYIWLLDDNIQTYHRLLSGYKIPIKSKEIFTSVEEYINRYTNVGVASHNLSGMIQGHKPHNVLSINTKCYSSLLIKTNLRFREFIYNEDVLLSIDCINLGLNTICFNHVLFKKKDSGTQKGGNYSIYKDGKYNNKCDETIALIKADVNIPDQCIKIISLKNKPRHLRINYSYLKNFNNKLIKNDEYKSIWKTGIHM